MNKASINTGFYKQNFLERYLGVVLLGYMESVCLTFFFFFFLTALGLRCCMRTFSNCGEWGLLFVAVRGLLVVVASLVAEHGL